MPSPFDADGRLRSNSRARSKSVENFATPFDSELRTGRVSSSVFALVSTIIGGGVLSLPYAFAKAGAVLGPLFLVASAAASDFSIYILVSSARRTGARNYEAVASHAFGKRARTATAPSSVSSTNFSSWSRCGGAAGVRTIPAGGSSAP